MRRELLVGRGTGGGVPTSKTSKRPRSPVASFRTHRNYLQAFAVAAGWDATDSDQSIERLLRALPDKGFKDRRTARGAGIDVDLARRFLRSAWGTSLVMRPPGEAVEPELVRWTANWAVVKAYYAVHDCFHALLVAKPVTVPVTHAATQREFSKIWGSTTVDLAPWTLVHSSSGARSGTRRTIVEPSGLSPMRAPTAQSAEALCAMALRTTWEGAFEAACRATREREKKRSLTRAERDKVASRVDRQSLLHYLYRLRRRMNYQDADMFARGAPGVRQAADALEVLQYLVDASVAVHEWRIAQTLGATTVQEWMAEFASEAGSLGVPIAMRAGRLTG